MTNERTQTNLPHEYWKGHVVGTNRGRLIIRLKQDTEIIKAGAVFKDEVFGPALLTFRGKLIERRMEMQIDDFWSPGLMQPLEGKLTLNFNSDYSEAEGKWETDIGTSGLCKLFPSETGVISWWNSVLSVRWFHSLKKYLPALYTIFLIIIAILELQNKIKITYPALILLLIPAPYIYRTHLGELISLFKIKRIGPVELEQKPIAPNITRIDPQTAAFQLLDQLLVHRSKLLIHWLVQKQSVRYEEFIEYAKQLGVPPGNMEATLQAILVSGCAIYDQANVKVTEFGKQYVAYLNRLTGSAPA